MCLTYVLYLYIYRDRIDWVFEANFGKIPVRLYSLIFQCTHIFFSIHVYILYYVLLFTVVLLELLLFTLLLYILYVGSYVHLYYNAFFRIFDLTRVVTLVPTMQTSSRLSPDLASSLTPNVASCCSSSTRWVGLYTYVMCSLYDVFDVCRVHLYYIDL